VRHSHAPKHAFHRGLTLLEVMISMAVLSVGLLGMLQLQILGMTANQGARAHTTALQLGRELVQGLEQRATDDPLLSGVATPASATPPTPFGALLDGSGAVPTTGVRAWNDANPVAGVRTDASIERDPDDGTVPIYRRRWTVWDYVSATGGPSVKVIAVSVVFRERKIMTPREVVLFTQRANTGLVLSNVAAFR